MSASIGVAVFDERGDLTGHDGWSARTIAMYAAKEAGRDRYVSHSHDDVSSPAGAGA